MPNRLTKLAPAFAWAVAGAVAVRRSQRGWTQVIPATSTPVDHTSQAMLAGAETSARQAQAWNRPAPPGVDASPGHKEEEPIPTQTGEGPGPNSPLDMPAPDWKESVKRAAKEFKEDRGTLTAAGMAFYWFLAIFPALLAAVGMLGLFNVSSDFVTKLTERITSALPGVSGILTGAIGESTKTGGSVLAALFGVLAALWSASSGAVGMQIGLDVAYDVKDDRKFVKKRLVAFELLLAILVLGGVATAFIVFGAPLGNALRDNLPFGSAFVVLWTVTRWVVGLIALVGLFASIYYLAPNRDTPKWVWVSPGGILAGAIWLVASLGFSIYVKSFSTYAETYGPISGVVVLLLWLYLTALAVILGGELNAELERQSAARKGQVSAES
ncbi:MAG TPA: YihY/virulence factor BrkB family protein [Acidimicrobiales bacterium]|nr:YihY/virulence factor BrkB family protein [Acidimicrobiales bacterium]